MNRISFFIFLFFSATWFTALSQPESPKSSFISPLTTSQGITGSYGEIRTDHFHSGVDLRTDGSIGKEVRATNDGYISRIKVSPVGYGKSIFIDHPNGLTSGYGHLDRYNDRINEYVRKVQYQLKSFDIDIFPKPNEFPIKKGELIAYSGNSGGSSGPHLHYEIRTTTDQRIINPIPQYLSISDSIAPVIRSLRIYELDSSSFSNGYPENIEVQIIKNKNEYTVNRIVNAYGKVGFGVEVFDKLNSMSTQCGFKSLSLLVNGKLYYRLVLNKFAFAETRYVNSVIDYSVKQNTNKEIVKLFVEPANFFSGIQKIQKKGLIDIQLDSIYRIEILACDASDNISKLRFDIQGVRSPAKFEEKKISKEEVVFLSCMMENSVINDTFILQIPKYSLYDNLYFTHSSKLLAGNPYSPLVRLHNPNVPLHQKVKLEVKPLNIPVKYQSKALLATFDKNRKIVAVGGEWNGGSIKGYISSFGDYFISLDTISPEIIPINIRQGSNLFNSSTIKFTVKDDFSGISKIEGYVDGKWALFDYDKKNDLIEYKIDKERITRGINHTLEITVKDNKANESRYKCDFIW